MNHPSNKTDYYQKRTSQVKNYFLQRCAFLNTTEVSYLNHLHPASPVLHSQLASSPHTQVSNFLSPTQRRASNTLIISSKYSTPNSWQLD